LHLCGKLIFQSGYKLGPGQMRRPLDYDLTIGPAYAADPVDYH